jgi:hypothetical protein
MVLEKLKSPFYRPVQFWYDAVTDKIWKLRLGCAVWRLEQPTSDEEQMVRSFNLKIA